MLTELDLNKCPTNSFALSFFQKTLIAQRLQDIMTTYALEQKVFRSPTYSLPSRIQALSAGLVRIPLASPKVIGVATSRGNRG